MRTDIVVGVDASRGSAAALAWALDDASRRGARVRAVLAWADDCRPAEVDAIAISPKLEHLATAADEVLGRLVAVARSTAARGTREGPAGAAVPVDLRTVYGTAAHVLLQESLDAGLLVIGAEPPAASGWALPGLVGDACAHMSPIPLVVVPEAAGTAHSPHRVGKPVLVGVDGSRMSVNAARWAAREAALRGVPLRVLHVAEAQGAAPAQGRVQVAIPVVTRTPMLPGKAMGALAVAGSGVHRCGRTSADDAPTGATADPADPVDRVIVEIQATPGAPPVERVSVRGGPVAKRLLEAAGQAQLLVLGGRGTGGFPALSLGSTAHQCLARISCPTAIIRGHRYRSIPGSAGPG
jgi:nucleotide-binding universal stress UspA family protein